MASLRPRLSQATATAARSSSRRTAACGSVANRHTDRSLTSTSSAVTRPRRRVVSRTGWSRQLIPGSPRSAATMTGVPPGSVASSRSWLAPAASGTKAARPCSRSPRAVRSSRNGAGSAVTGRSSGAVGSSPLASAAAGTAEPDAIWLSSSSRPGFGSSRLSAPTPRTTAPRYGLQAAARPSSCAITQTSANVASAPSSSAATSSPSQPASASSRQSALAPPATPATPAARPEPARLSRSRATARSSSRISARSSDISPPPVPGASPGRAHR